MDQILDQIGTFATKTTYRDLPPEVASAGINRLLDNLACAVAAHDSMMVQVARALAGPAVPRAISGRILGSKEVVAADAGAFATSCMIRDMDLNDDYPGGHPSDSLGGILAVAPTVKASGEQLITSVVVAYEVIIAMLRSVPLRDLGWDQSIAISVGAAAGLANLLKLDQAVARHAISMTAVANTALRATRAGQLSMWKGAATAYSVRNAVFGVQLAQLGMTGPESPFTGRHGFAEMIAGKPVELPKLGGDVDNFYITDVYTKYWPVAYSLQAVVWAGVELRKKVQPDQIADLKVYTYAFSRSESGSEPAKWDPKTRETADHSIPYVLTRALLNGKIDHEAFLPDAYLEPSIRPLMKSISVHVDDEIEKKIHQNIVELRLVATDKAGKTHEVTILNPLGHEKRPLTKVQMAVRFQELCSPVFGQARADEALRIWSDIDKEHDVTPAFDALTIGG